ncbi:hypothetical protein ABMA28_014960 [Loxostege sticticalis]|uniref:Reverse transcriptase domain-containing protein n=1 Tax=Loxostege sticticalis TaxID=481309 RepID=A0ABD0TDT7_LOXSC
MSPRISQTIDLTIPSSRPRNSNHSIKLIESKISDGDLRGASNLLFSNDVVAPDCPETLSTLADKHPAPAATLLLPNPPIPDSAHLLTKEDEVMASIFSFKSGSASGLDGLSPQHLKDLLSVSVGDTGRVLLHNLTLLINLMLSGKVNSQICDILYGANLIALKKKDGGIRPIAVGSTFRRIASKICCKHIAASVAADFQPVQLGFGIKGGCEAAVHAVRTFLSLNAGEVVLKVDVKNAFNSADRGTLLTQALDKSPLIYNYLWQCYSEPSKLLYQNNLIYSSVGCQQGDPLGPAIFSLAIHPIISSLNSKLNVWYLDDGTIAGDASTVLSDLHLIINQFSNIGLELNFSKCELFIPDAKFSPDQLSQLITKFSSIAPNIKIVDQKTLRLLGAPIFDDAIPIFIQEQICKFKQSSEKLFKINPHMALSIIRFCTFAPKFTYFLRCTHFWRFSDLLLNLDTCLQSVLSKILNCNFTAKSWAQATLPIRFGGLGTRSLSGIALPAFLSSAYGTATLFNNILRSSVGVVEVAHLADARSAWSAACPGVDPPKSLSSQKQWDEPLCSNIQNNLISTSDSASERARLLAVSQAESGYWLQALPSANVGTLLDRTSLTLSVCLRVGAKINHPHRCRCGDHVCELGHHGLSCQLSAGRVSRHACINDVIRRALVAINVPAVLEPNGIFRDDGKRPDGMSLIPWKLGRSLIWDATCVDTLAPSHLSSTSSVAGAAATSAECLKRRKYAALNDGYIFVPFGVETMGPWGPSARALFKEISKRLSDATGDQRAGSYLGQRISLAIQRGNAASLLGTIPGGSAVGDIFYNL